MSNLCPARFRGNSLKHLSQHLNNAFEFGVFMLNVCSYLQVFTAYAPDLSAAPTLTLQIFIALQIGVGIYTSLFSCT